MKSPLHNYDNYIIRMPSRKAQGKPVSLKHPPEGVIMGNLTGKSPFEWSSQQVTFTRLMAMGKKSLSDSRTNKHLINKVEIMVNRKLELVFIDKEGKWYPLDEVDREELALGLEKISKEVAKRLQLLKEQR